MKKIITISLILILISCNNFVDDNFTFKTDSFQVTCNKYGIIEAFLEIDSGQNFLADNDTTPILSIKIDEEILSPLKVEFEKSKHILLLDYPKNIRAQIQITEKSSHLVFELIEIYPMEEIELITWGPYPTTISKIIGETIGVVQGEKYALGIQSLNPKTLGGYPWNDNDCMPQLDIFEGGDYSDLSEKGKRHVLYRVEAAKPSDFGSTLQAYCRNRNRERIVANWGHEKYTTSVFDDEGILGSKIALFGCPKEKILDTIKTIELEEKLPHPKIDGEWGKTSRSATAAYMILEFGEKNIQNALDYTKQAGLRYLYHPGPFKNWGHFELKKEPFPTGWDGLKQCVTLAKEQEILIGVHTLSNFITTNDPYVTPIPDKRLAIVGFSSITEEINSQQTEISIESLVFFDQFQNDHLRTVRIEDELIRYGKVSDQKPWKLLECQRGAFGTTAAFHDQGRTVSKLADHAYKVFLTNPELSIEMSSKIAELFNYCGLRQISFDGLEGNRSTGMGNYGEILFTTTWYDHLSDEIKSHYIADASRTSHYFWHLYTRMNWGEPWYAGFRESQTEYRLKNQKYFQRNLMPAMLGWFRMSETTSIEDIEWMLARSAGFDAGYGFVTDFKVLEKNGQTDGILRSLSVWEQARMNDIFSDEQKKRMQDINREFHLENQDIGKWNLYEVFSYKFKHERRILQPGEPLFSTFKFANPTETQTLQFILTSENEKISNIKLEIDNYKEIILPTSLEAGQKLKYSGGKKAIIYSLNWKQIREIDINSAEFQVSKGNHTLNFDCFFSSSENDAVVKLELRIIGPSEKTN